MAERDRSKVTLVLTEADARWLLRDIQINKEAPDWNAWRRVREELKHALAECDCAWEVGGMNRSEHMAWAKTRALEYVDAGDLHQAFASMGSDLNKHPETIGHFGVTLGMALLMSGKLNTAPEMRKFIEGFN